MSEKRAAYGCDVTYASAKEAGFDFLRDQVAYDRDAIVHRPFNFVLIDEADSILIDEARIPLVISGAEDRASWDTHLLASVVQSLLPDRDFETDRGIALEQMQFLESLEYPEWELRCVNTLLNRCLGKMVWFLVLCRSFPRHTLLQLFCPVHNFGDSLLNSQIAAEAIEHLLRREFGN